jgi:Ca2+-binding RTX toxin-like protein
MGQAGNDTLDGGAGVDRLAGGLGDDLYLVDSRSDVIVELANEGADTVRASTSYTLSANIENLVLEEGGDFTAGGNALANVLRGNSGKNVLAGGLGKDTLEGGLGDDIYVLSDSLDVIIDTGGVDTIRSPLDVSLPADIENVELIGLNDVSAVGHAGNNVLIGNIGANLLDGGAGVDTLTGGEGGDQFMVAYNALGQAPDVVMDFVSGTDLLIVDYASLGLSPEALGLLSSGGLNHDSFVKGVGARALDPNDHFLLDTAQSLLMFDPDGSGSATPLALLKFQGMVDGRFNSGDVFIGI